MEPTTLYLIFVAVLFLLAVSDLVVGVSNDAVNFLNNSIGSKVAPRYIIMIVASLGIALGATFSSGMMEVARKGIFNPEMFVFSDLMVLFVAVMVTDIILLDLFNTFGMPTSTTVSIVFELLGAAVAVALLKLIGDGGSLATLPEFINGSKATQIVVGIFLSILLAFGLGMMGQYLSRLLFTFDFEGKLKRWGPLYGGIAVTIITYFMLIKGAKGSSFISNAGAAWIETHTLLLMGLSLLGWTLILSLLARFTRFHILRFVVLVGTFSLAMAFAGNDLVNFIGVPMAGLESFKAWRAGGMDPELMNMGLLGQPVRTSTLYLLVAGIIMVVTLWISRKARSVTETEVSLGRQGYGTERFQPNLLARFLVRTGMALGSVPSRVLSTGLTGAIGRRLDPGKAPKSSADPPSFDLVRASVNLTMASILIAFATSLQMPLSTTYVAFMVAMGSSLADQAWDRDTAVFRVAGVLAVIGGWFFTAAAAFTAAAVFAAIIWYGGLWAVIGLLLLAVALLGRTHFLHRRRMTRQERTPEEFLADSVVLEREVLDRSKHQTAETIEVVSGTYAKAINGLLAEDANVLKIIDEQIDLLKERHTWVQNSVHLFLKRIESENPEAGTHFVKLLDLSSKLIESDRFIAKTCRKHVRNYHKPLRPTQQEALREICTTLTELLNQIAAELVNGGSENPDARSAALEAFEARLDQFIGHQVQRIQKGDGGPRSSMFFLTVVLETRRLAETAERLAQLVDQRAFNVPSETSSVAT